MLQVGAAHSTILQRAAGLKHVANKTVAVCVCVSDSKYEYLTPLRERSLSCVFACVGFGWVSLEPRQRLHLSGLCAGH